VTGRRRSGCSTGEGVESRQRVLVSEPAVEPSGDGARWLGVTYWCAVDRFTHGGIRATWGEEGGRLRLLGGLTLLRFSPPELQYTDGIVSCRYAIEGGLLALRAGGSVTLAQRPGGGASSALRPGAAAAHHRPRRNARRSASRGCLVGGG
jgi:hypothetical protein